MRDLLYICNMDDIDEIIDRVKDEVQSYVDYSDNPYLDWEILIEGLDEYTFRGMEDKEIVDKIITFLQNEV